MAGREFNWFTAAFAGFALLWRRPLSYLAWLLVVVVAALPAGIGMFILLRGGLAGRPESAMWAPTAMGALLTTIAGAFIIAAVYRAILHPEQRGFGSVRFTRAELRAAVIAATFALLSMALGAAGSELNEALNLPRWSSGTTANVLGMAVFVGLAGRLALVGPAVVDGGFRAFAAGWRLGEGRWLPLGGMGLVAWAVALGLNTAFQEGYRWYIENNLDPDGVGFSALYPAIVAFGVGGLLLNLALAVVLIAPGAVVFARLRDRAAPAAEVFD